MVTQRQRKMVVTAPPLTDEELTSRVREALQGKGLKHAELNKEVSKALGKAEGVRALELAQHMAAMGELYRVAVKGAEWFFANDPFATLDRVVPGLLREKGPLPAKDLKGKPFRDAVERMAPGHSQLIEEWREGGIERGVMYELPGTSKAKLLSADAPKRVADEELLANVSEALRGKGLKHTDLAKEIASLFGEAESLRALQLTRDRAADGPIRRVIQKGTEWFFGADPIATLDRLVPELLRREGHLSSKDLRASVEKAAPGHSLLLPNWQKGALPRGLVFEVTLPGPPKLRVLSAEPDLKLSLSKTLAELNNSLPALERQGITRERVIEYLCAELKVEAPPMPVKRSSREVFLEALRRFAADNPRGALLPVRELRARAGLGKVDFDTAALDLSKEGLLVLHYHDHAAALSEAEQSGLVRDALGRHYVGIALRGGLS
jgi:hypothetical protein